MKAIFGLTAAAGLMLAASSVSAATYDFVHAIDSGTLGESYYTTFNTADHSDFSGLPSVSLDAGYYDYGTGSFVDTPYVYADYGNAGFGACRAVLDGTSAGADTGNQDNKCAPSSDDSIQSVQLASGTWVSEYLKITFNEGTQLTSLTVDANHDGGLTPTSLFAVWATGDANWTFVQTDTLDNGFFTYALDKYFEAGTSLYLKADCNDIYLSAMEVSKVPLPASGLLLLGGLGGLAAVKRRRRKAA